MSGRWLLDTCILSEYARANPNARVMSWLAAADEAALALSVLTIAELRRGALALPPSRHRSALESWIDEALPARFLNRVLPVGRTVADVWAERQARLDRQGRPLPVMDGLIAATAVVHGDAVATRNEREFTVFGAPIVNPGGRSEGPILQRLSNLQDCPLAGCSSTGLSMEPTLVRPQQVAGQARSSRADFRDQQEPFQPINSLGACAR